MKGVVKICKGIKCAIGNTVLFKLFGLKKTPTKLVDLSSRQNYVKIWKSMKMKEPSKYLGHHGQKNIYIKSRASGTAK